MLLYADSMIRCGGIQAADSTWYNRNGRLGIKHHITYSQAAEGSQLLEGVESDLRLYAKS